MTTHLDLRDLALRAGERLERAYSMDVAPIVSGGVSYQVLLPDGVDVTVERVAGGFLVDIRADAKVYGPCARCLAETAFVVHAEQQEFAPTAKGGWEETDQSAFINELVVDLDGIVREAIILALPPQILCKEDCRGLCPQCGKDLNQGGCDCPRAEMDERWGKLGDLALPDEKDS